MSRRSTKSLFRRFYEKVNIVPFEDGCWEWTGALSNKGYAKFGINRDGKWRNALGSHVAWFIEFGRWPVNNLCHTCDNPKCVRVPHLFEGTPLDNVRDCIAKGRFRNGRNSLTHCKRGHLLSGANLYQHGTHRHCRTCKNDWKREARRRGEY